MKKGHLLVFFFFFRLWWSLSEVCESDSEDSEMVMVRLDAFFLFWVSLEESRRTRPRLFLGWDPASVPSFWSGLSDLLLLWLENR